MGANGNNVRVVISGDDQSGPALQSAIIRIQSLEAMVKRLQVQIADGMAGAARDTTEAKAAFMSLGEEVGVRMPRHLATALASFASLREAAASIALGAELGLGIAVFDKLKDKITELTQEWAGWGKDQQELYKDDINVNNQLLELANQRKQLERQIVLDRLEGAAKLQKAEDFALEDAKDKKEQLVKLQAQIAELMAKAAPHGIVEMRGRTAVKVEVSGLDSEDTKKLQDLQNSVLLINAALKNQKLAAEDSGIALAKAYGDEADKAAQKVIDDQLLIWKQTKDIQDANEAADRAAAAMMQALTPLAKQLTDVLAIPSAAPIDPLQNLKSLHQQITTALEAERAKEQQLTAEAVAGGESRLLVEQELAKARGASVQEISGLVAQYQKLALLSKDDATINQAKRFEDQLGTLTAKATTLGQVIGNDVKTNFTDAFAAMISGTQSASAAFGNMAKAIVNELAKIVAEMLVMRAVEALIGFFNPGPSVESVNAAGLSTLSSLKLPGFVAGGNPTVGDWSWVGEEGPELVKFGSSATVIPHSASVSMASGGGGDTYYQDFRGADAGMLQQVQNMIRVSEERSVARAKIEFIEMQRRRA